METSFLNPTKFDIVCSLSRNSEEPSKKVFSDSAFFTLSQPTTFYVAPLLFRLSTLVGSWALNASKLRVPTYCCSHDRLAKSFLFLLTINKHYCCIMAMDAPLLKLLEHFLITVWLSMLLMLLSWSEWFDTIRTMNASFKEATTVPITGQW